ncbi:MAG: UDP-N-acetylmuramate--L-alanine ligase [Chloroflexi bacterium]|nr:UDP-N-acetylmuramate--L-alanine ligase [Chloroflexota bacterium]
MAKIHPPQHIHLVGIGGSGLSAIARVLLGQGYKVSGSDRTPNALTEALARDGATIYTGHDASYINGAEALIITSAVKDDHVEVAAARTAGIPVYKRQDIIADVMEGKTVIAVAGTKGKTTTTSMIVHILRECGKDPSYIVGGVMGNTGTNAGVGQGDIFVVEADEYENMFLGLKPDIAVITNIEWDHPDFFKTPGEMVEAFENFIAILKENDRGVLIASADDERTAIIATRQRAINRSVLWGKVDRVLSQLAMSTSTYGVDMPADYQAVNLRINGNGNTLFDVEDMGTVCLHLPGKHNIRNALAALLAADTEGISFIEAAKALESFIPPARRFELRADVNGVAIIDDYAHNPMSIRAVLDAARQRYPERAIWAVWQPHTFSRTQALWDDFVKAFAQADHVLVTDIYAAREQRIPGVTSAAIVAAMQHPDARHTPAFADAVAALREGVTAPAAIIIMSAGDAPQIGVEYVKWLEARE